MINRCMVFLGLLAFVALSLQGCATTPKRKSARVAVQTFILEIDQRDQNGVKLKQSNGR